MCMIGIVYLLTFIQFYPWMICNKPPKFKKIPEESLYMGYTRTVALFPAAFYTIVICRAFTQQCVVLLMFDHVLWHFVANRSFVRTLNKANSHLFIFHLFTLFAQWCITVCLNRVYLFLRDVSDNKLPTKNIVSMCY